jgi:hypothetical protein
VWQIGGHYQGGIVLSPPYAGVITLEFIGTTANTANAVSFTFTDHAIGTESADRLVVVAVHIDSGASTIDSLTIGGNTAAIHANSDDHTSTGASTSISSLVVPTGTTATIVVNCSGISNRCAIGVWTVKNYTSSTPQSTDQLGSASSTGLSLTLDLSAGCVGVAANTNTTGGRVNAFSVGSEEYDDNIEAGGCQAAGASLAATGSAAETVTISHTGDECGSVGATWK